MSDEIHHDRPPVDRRGFLKQSTIAAGGLATGGLLATGCGGGGGAGVGKGEQPTVRWQLASSFSRKLDTIFGAAEVFAERLSAITDGRFQIKVSAGGEVPPFQVLDLVQQGTYAMGHSASYYYRGKHPALAFDTSVPFGMTARQHLAWQSQGGLELVQGILSDFNLVCLPGGNTGVQMGGWFNREIGSAADLRGLRIRIPGLGGEVMNALGASVQNLSGAEILPNLERGTLDAAEWVGPYDDQKFGLQDVAKYYYYPGWWEPGPALSFYINKDAWSNLPASYQAAVQAAAADAGQDMMIKYDAKNPVALEQLLQGGVELRRFSDDVMEAAEVATREILESEASQDPAYRKLYEHWKKFLKQSKGWFGTAEYAYSKFVHERD